MVYFQELMEIKELYKIQNKINNIINNYLNQFNKIIQLWDMNKF